MNGKNENVVAGEVEKGILVEENKKAEPVIAFKGTDKNGQCRGFQYEVGKSYEIDPDAVKCCRGGFHACRYPLDAFIHYYPGDQSRYFLVEQGGRIDADNDQNRDTKQASSHILIKAELTIANLVKAAFEYVWNRCNPAESENETKRQGAAASTGDGSTASSTGYCGAAASTGDFSAASSTGDRGAASSTGHGSTAASTGYYGAAFSTGYCGTASSTGYCGAAASTGYYGAAFSTGDRGAAASTGYYGAAASTGDFSAASSTGDRGAAASTGYCGTASSTGYCGAAIVNGKDARARAEKDSIAVANGRYAWAKGEVGSILVLVERGAWNGTTYPVIGVESFIIDGETRKPNQWYALENGEVVEKVDEDDDD